MAKFEIVSKYSGNGLSLPTRETGQSAGYDFCVAEDIIVPSFFNIPNEILKKEEFIKSKYTLDEIGALYKENKYKPTLVPTGIKCQLDPGYYLELSVRSSTPLKYWLILANGVGIIDADYYNNPDNEGHIFFQMINLGPLDIKLQKGDRIGQGIIKRYYLADGDSLSTGASRVGGFGSTGTNKQDNIVRYSGVSAADVDQYRVNIYCETKSNFESKTLQGWGISAEDSSHRKHKNPELEYIKSGKGLPPL